MGKKTSVWLSDDVVAAWHASRVPLAELVRRGLGMSDAPGIELPDLRAELRHVIREELSAVTVVAADRTQSGYSGHGYEYDREAYLEDP